MYCWQSDYYFKRYCQAVQDNFNSNQIYLGDEGRVCLRAYLLRVRLLFMRREKLRQKSVADVK